MVISEGGRERERGGGGGGEKKKKEKDRETSGWFEYRDCAGFVQLSTMCLSS